MLRHRRLLGLLVLAVLGTVGFFLGRQWTAPRFERSQLTIESLHPDVAAAIEKALQRVEGSPRTAEAWGELGMVLMAHDIADPARDCFRQAEELDANDMRWPYLLGYTYEEVNYETALQAYLNALALEPGSIPVCVRVASLQMRLGMLEDSYGTLQAGIQRAPENPYLLVTLGRLYLIRGELDAAEAAFSRAADQPNWMPQPAYLELVKMAARKQDLPRAFELHRRLLQLPQVGQMEFPDPVIERVRFLEGLSKLLAERADLALARGDARTAVSLYEAFVKKRPEMPNAQVNLAQAYAMSGDWATAVTRYQQVLERDGDNVSARYGLAVAYSQSGQVEQAMHEYERALQLKPDHKNALLQLGILREQTGNSAAALECYLQACEIDPSFPPSHLAAGILLMNQGELARAEEYVTRAAQLSPGDPLPQQYMREIQQRSVGEPPSTK